MLQPNYLNKRFKFCNVMQNAKEDDDYHDRLVFSDEVTFHLNGKVIRHNVRIWSTGQPVVVVAHERDSLHLTFLAQFIKQRCMACFVYKIVMGVSYLDDSVVLVSTIERRLK